MALSRVNEVTTTIPSEAAKTSSGGGFIMWLAIAAAIVIVIMIILEFKKKKKQRDVEKELHEKYINESFIHNEGYLEFHRLYPPQDSNGMPVAIGGGLQSVIKIVGSQKDGTDGYEHFVGYTSPKAWALFVWKWPFFNILPFSQFKPLWYKLFYELLLIRVPARKTMKIITGIAKDENGKEKKDINGQRIYTTEELTVPLNILIKNPLQKKIVLICDGLQKIGHNYYPLYRDRNKQLINWEQIVIPMELGHLYQDATRSLALKVTELAELRADSDEDEQKIRKRGAESSGTRSE